MTQDKDDKKIPPAPLLPGTKIPQAPPVPENDLNTFISKLKHPQSHNESPSSTEKADQKYQVKQTAPSSNDDLLAQIRNPGIKLKKVASGETQANMKNNKEGNAKDASNAAAASTAQPAVSHANLDQNAEDQRKGFLNAIQDFKPENLKKVASGDKSNVEPPVVDDLQSSLMTLLASRRAAIKDKGDDNELSATESLIKALQGNDIKALGEAIIAFNEDEEFSSKPTLLSTIIEQNSAVITDESIKNYLKENYPSKAEKVVSAAVKADAAAVAASSAAPAPKSEVAPKVQLKASPAMPTTTLNNATKLPNAAEVPKPAVVATGTVPPAPPLPVDQAENTKRMTPEEADEIIRGMREQHITGFEVPEFMGGLNSFNELQEQKPLVMQAAKHYPKKFISPLNSTEVDPQLLGSINRLDASSRAEFCLSTGIDLQTLNMQIAEKSNDLKQQFGDNIKIYSPVNLDKAEDTKGMTPEEAEEILAKMRKLETSGFIHRILTGDEEKSVIQLAEQYPQELIENGKVKDVYLGALYSLPKGIEEGIREKVCAHLHIDPDVLEAQFTKRLQEIQDFKNKASNNMEFPLKPFDAVPVENSASNPDANKTPTGSKVGDGNAAEAKPEPKKTFFGKVAEFFTKTIPEFFKKVFGKSTSSPSKAGSDETVHTLAVPSSFSKESTPPDLNQGLESLPVTRERSTNKQPPQPAKSSQPKSILKKGVPGPKELEEMGKKEKKKVSFKEPPVNDR